MLPPDITHCLTIGSRPDLLARTLDSIAPELRLLPTLAINDFGDPETTAVLHDRCPTARLVGPGRHLGHHPAIDALYAEVATPYIWHGEDDWQFHRADFLAPALHLLAAEPRISCVCFRDLADFSYLTAADRAKVTQHSADGISYARMDGLHREWHGYTFNPHLSRRSLWQEIGGFAQFRKERHLSRHLRAQGMFVAFLEPGACRHIGDGHSMFPQPPKRFAGLRDWWRGR